MSNTIFTHLKTTGLAAALLTGLTAGAQAATLDLTITNTQDTGGLYLTPLFTAFHDGSFDTFNPGEAASAALENLAEEGSPAGFLGIDGVEANVITSPGGFAGAPVIDPGESATIRVEVDETSQRWFSFLSMVIPSNDNFIGNGNPLAYEIFNAAGAFTGLNTINILGGDIWDAGTEVNNGAGAAFGTLPGPSSDENGTVALEPSLSDLIGLETVAGTFIDFVPGENDIFATIEIAPVPLPAGMPLLLAGLGAFAFVRRQKAQS